MQEIEDIIENSHSTALFLWWQWVLICLCFIIIMYAILFVLKKKSKKSHDASLSCVQIALSQLALLDINSTHSNALAIDLSIIVRKFLRCAYNDNALFETAEEFHHRSKDLDRLPAEAKDTLQSYLAKVTEHKYAPNPNHPAALENLIDQAITLVKQLDSIASASSLINVKES